MNSERDTTANVRKGWKADIAKAWQLGDYRIVDSQDPSMSGATHPQEIVDSVTFYTAFGVGAALAAMVGMFAHVVGYDRDRAFYAAVLTVVGSLYVLFAVMAGGGPGLIPEIGFFGVFAALAAVGFRTSLWIVAAGLALHGAFDFVRHAFFAAPGAPEWWPAFCGSYDIVAALGMTTLLLNERRRVDIASVANR